MRSVLIIGKNGQVSTYLQAELKDYYSMLVAGRELIDLSKTDQIQNALTALQPSLIINPAAYTAVDLAENEPELAFRINRDAVAEIADYSKANNVPLIHFSTDYVFAGDADQPYTETDSPAPTGVYGQSKLAGELALLQSGAPALILRTSWVYSNQGKNFYNTMLALAESRNELSVVADQIGAPTYAGSIASVCKSLLDVISQQRTIEPSQLGVYHFSCGGQTSWAEFARALFAANKVDTMTVNSIPSSEYPTPAKRPAYSVLDNSKLQSVFNLSLPDWRDGLASCVAQTSEMRNSEQSEQA